MTSRHNFGNSDAPGPSPPSPVLDNPYKFSPEELKVLNDCNRESFFKRCLPLGTVLGTATYYAVQAGYLNRSPKWGAAPKVLVVSVLSYFLGKLSYQQKCAEKFMQLPNSRIGAMLRHRKQGSSQESLESPAVSLMPFTGTPSESYSDVGSTNDSALDTVRPDQEGLDDSLRPSLDNPVYEDETLPVPQNKTTTYEELRKQNREDYQKQRTSNFKEYMSPPNDTPRRLPVEPETDILSPPKRTNKYGDVFD